MEPITVAQLLLLLIVGFLLFRTHSGPTRRRAWRGFRRDPSIFPAFSGNDARRRESQFLRERSKRFPVWLIGAIFVLVGALNWWLNR